MTKIKTFYIDKARYIAVDGTGNQTYLDIDYWENSFRVSKSNEALETLARKLF